MHRSRLQQQVVVLRRACRTDGRQNGTHPDQHTITTTRRASRQSGPRLKWCVYCVSHVYPALKLSQTFESGSTFLPDERMGWNSHPKLPTAILLHLALGLSQPSTAVATLVHSSRKVLRQRIATHEPSNFPFDITLPAQCPALAQSCTQPYLSWSEPAVTGSVGPPLVTFSILAVFLVQPKMFPNHALRCECANV
jgi:hypothetical protein